MTETRSTMNAIAAALEANMPGVTPGEWAIKERLGKDEAWCDWHSVGPLHLMGGEATADDRHIALCNPNNIAALLAERKAMRDEIERLREYYEAREEISRVGLFDATSAQWDRLNTITEALKNRSIS